MSAAEPDGRQLQQDIAPGRQIQHLQEYACLSHPLAHVIMTTPKWQSHSFNAVKTRLACHNSQGYSCAHVCRVKTSHDVTVAY